MAEEVLAMGLAEVANAMKDQILSLFKKIENDVGKVGKLMQLQYLLFLPDEYIEDIWMITSLTRMWAPKTGKVSLEVPGCFEKFEVVDMNYNGSETVIRAIALTKPPYPNMVYVYGDVTNPHYILFKDDQDEKYVTIHLDGQTGTIYFDFYLSDDAVKTAQAQSWYAMNKAIEEGNILGVLRHLFDPNIILKGYRPEDTQMSPDYVPLGPDSVHVVHVTPDMAKKISKLNDEAQNVKKETEDKHDEAMKVVEKALGAMAKAEEETGVTDYDVYQLDNIVTGLENNDYSKVVEAAKHIANKYKGKVKVIA